MDEQALLSAIWDDPYQEGVRLVYADWLEEHGQTERAELIRVQCTSAALPEEDERRSPLLARAEELLRSHGAIWAEGLPAEVGWRRGFPEILEIDVRSYLRHAALLERLAPVQAVWLGWPAGDAEPGEAELAPADAWDWDEEYAAAIGAFVRLGQCPQLERWVELETHGAIGWMAFEALVGSPHLKRLRRLVVRNNEVGPGVGMVADARFAHLVHLDVFDSNSAGGRPGTDVFQSIVTCPHLARLEYLDFGANELDNEAIQTLATAPCAPRLQTLMLSGNTIDNRGLEQIGSSANFVRLTHLDLSWSMSNDGQPVLNDDALDFLVRSPLLAQMQHLNLCYNQFSDAGLARFGASPAGRGLRFLGIGGRAVSPAGIQMLLSSPHLQGLRHLELMSMIPTAALVSVVCSAPQLTHLTLAWEAPPDRASVRRLKKRFGARWLTE